jgi:hypothetical protein
MVNVRYWTVMVAVRSFQLSFAATRNEKRSQPRRGIDDSTVIHDACGCALQTQFSSALPPQTLSVEPEKT